MKKNIAAILALACVVLVMPSGLSAACVNPPPGLVSWWPGEGNGNDIVGSNPGAVGSGVSFSPGAVGQAFNFAGTGVVVVAASGSLDVGAGSGFSIECWIRPNDLSTRQPLLEWRNGANNGVLFSASDSLCGDNGAGSLFANIVDANGNSHPLYTGVGLLTTSNFQHVALTYDKGTGIGTLYINGTMAAKAHLGKFTPQTSYPLYLGQSMLAGSLATYNGLMDEVSVYNSALSLREIRAIYMAGASGKCRPSAPYIVSQPSSQATVVGGNASFSVVAGGSQPLNYQWRLGGNAVSGATDSVLNLSNVQLSDAGNYSVIVANLAGSVTSSNALLSVSTGGCVTASSSLVSWWPAEGNGNDVAGSNPGTASGVSYGPGEVGQAFSFNGTNGSVFVPASGSLNVGLSNGLTIECWIKPGDLSVRHPLVEWNNGGTFGVHFYVSQDWNGGGGPGDLFANITDTGAGWHPIFTGPGVLNTSNWQHVAVTYDKSSGLGKLYLNGAQVASANLGIFTPQTSYNLYFGRRASPEVVAPYVGGMDEVSVYSSALSSGEIQSIYNAGSLGKCQSPVSPYILTQPSSQTTVVGGNASFSVVAGGSQPLSYQWRLEGNALSGATGSSLSLNNVQLSDAGSYSVLVSNTYGTITSSNALLSVSTGGCVTASSSLVSWWPAEGNGNDIAGSNPGTVSGVSYIPGEVGQAFNFNGTNGSVFIPASGSLNVGLSNGLTIECWIKPGDLSVRHPLVEWNNGGTFGVHFYVSQDWNGGGGPGDLFANITDTGAGWHPIFTGPGVLDTSNWQHVAVTYDKTSGMGKLYLNGAQVASANLGIFTPQTSYNLYFGRRASPEVVPPYVGGMDEVSVYSRALNAGEIQSIYLAGTSGKCQSPTAPFIITQPASQTVNAGANATLSVSAGGTQPLSYQWRLEGNALSGATASSLSLSNVQSSDAGTYSVVVSNAFGSALSSNATLTVNQAVCTNAPIGLVSWWPAEGNGNDIAGSNPGAVSGVSYSAGEVNQAFNFSGTNGSVFIPASGSLNVGLSNGLTIECWIKPGELSVRHPLVEWNNGGTFGVHFYVSQDWNGGGGPGDLFANITDTGAGWHPIFTGPGVLNTSNWQHVAVTYDKTSGLGKLYLNGAQVASANLGIFTPQTSYNLYFGRRASPEVVAPYVGGMDEVSLYSRALSGGEIQNIYNAGSQGKCGTHGGVAPSITTQPASQTVNVGANVTFSVVADGTQPLSYQWRFGETNLSGATGSSLSLSNVQMSAAGPYSVVVSNAFGSALSSNATLTVNRAVCTNAPAGLVSWWPAEGNGNDIAGSNPGAVSGGVTYSAGEVGQAFNFNGTNRSVFIPAAASLNVGLSNGLTIECWIKPGDLSVRHPLVEWNDGGTFGVHFYVSQDWNGGGGPGDLFANITDTGGGWHPVFTSPGVLNTSNWQHVAVTYDKTSGSGKLYLNGAQVASAALGSFTPQTSYNLYFGLRASPEAVQPYLGGMDEVSLYNRALSAGEIQGIFNAGSQGKCGTHGGVAPFIINQPASQTVAAGTNATFSVSAGGTQPLSYQWRFRGTNLNGATSSLLSLSNVQSSDAGTYSAVVSNGFGSVTSSNAVLTVNTGACVNAPGGIVSWWPAEGNGNDVAGSNPGTASGVSYSAGEVGQAFNFNTSTGSVFMAASPGLNVGLSNGFTVECWIKPSDFTPLHPLVEWNNGSSFGVHFYHSTSWFGDNIQGNLLANIVDTSGGYHPVYSAAGVLSSNNIQHVALTYDKASGVGKLYVNGVEVANASLGSFTPQTSYNLYLGKRASGGVPSYSGLMDEVSLYGRALSQAEIQGIYNAGGAGKCHSSGVNVAEVPPGTMMISKALPGGFDVSFKGIPGREYEIQRAPSISGPWTTLTTVVVEPDGSGFYVDTGAPASEAFYRNVIR